MTGIFLIIAGLVVLFSIVYFLTTYRQAPHQFIPWIFFLPLKAGVIYRRFPPKGALPIEDVAKLVSLSVEDIRQICVRVSFRPAMQSRYNPGDLVTYFSRPFNKAEFDRLRFGYLLSCIFGGKRYFSLRSVEGNSGGFREVS